MVTIEVENLISHMSMEHNVSRVPCNGEHILIGNDLFEVVQVIHFTDLNPNNKTVAVIRIR